MRSWDRAEFEHKEEREKEHILHLQNVDFHRHRQLFLQEEPIETLEPLQKDLFCYHCIRQLSSSALERVEESYKIHGSLLLFRNGTIQATTYETRSKFLLKFCINCRECIEDRTQKIVNENYEIFKKEYKKKQIKEEIYEKKILEKKRGFSYKKKQTMYKSKPDKKPLRSYHMLR